MAVDDILKALYFLNSDDPQNTVHIIFENTIYFTDGSKLELQHGVENYNAVLRGEDRSGAPRS